MARGRHAVAWGRRCSSVGALCKAKMGEEGGAWGLAAFFLELSKIHKKSGPSKTISMLMPHTTPIHSTPIQSRAQVR